MSGHAMRGASVRPNRAQRRPDSMYCLRPTQITTLPTRADQGKHRGHCLHRADQTHSPLPSQPCPAVCLLEGQRAVDLHIRRANDAVKGMRPLVLQDLEGHPALGTHALGLGYEA
jgi:hypothetical protein